MTANELRRAHLKALGISNDYRWKIAEKNGIVRYIVWAGIEGFNNDEWDKVASEEERKQAAILDNEAKIAWLAYQEALREEEKIVQKGKQHGLQTGSRKT